MHEKVHITPERDTATVKSISVNDFKTEMFDGGSLKRHVSRETIINPNSWYYKLSIPRSRSY